MTAEACMAWTRPWLFAAWEVELQSSLHPDSLAAPPRRSLGFTFSREAASSGGARPCGASPNSAAPSCRGSTAPRWACRAATPRSSASRGPRSRSRCAGARGALRRRRARVAAVPQNRPPATPSAVRWPRPRPFPAPKRARQTRSTEPAGRAGRDLHLAVPRPWQRHLQGRRPARDQRPRHRRLRVPAELPRPRQRAPHAGADAARRVRRHPAGDDELFGD